MKKNKFWLLTIITSIVLPSVLAATTRTAQQGLFGDLIYRMTNTLQEFLTYTLTIPHPYSVAGTSMQEVVPLWSVFAVFTLLFAIIFAASAKIKIFDEEHKGPRKAFCIALALIVMFGTPITELFVVVFAGYFTSLLSLLIVVGFILGLWLILFLIPGRAMGAGSKFSGESKQMRAEGHRMDADAMRVRHDANIEKSDLRRSKKGFNKIRRFLNKERKASGNLKQHLTKVREELNLLERIRESPTQVAEAKQRIRNELSDVIPIIDKELRMDEKIRNIERKVQQITRRDWGILQKERGQLKDEERLMADLKAKHPDKKFDEAGLITAYRKVLQDWEEITQIERELSGIIPQLETIGVQLKQHVEAATIDVRNNNFPQAIFAINDALNLIVRQEELITEISRLDNLAIGVSIQGFKYNTYLSNTEEKDIKKEKIEELEFDSTAKAGGRIGVVRLP
jgi:hypothetical protein